MTHQSFIAMRPLGCDDDGLSVFALADVFQRVKFLSAEKRIETMLGADDAPFSGTAGPDGDAVISYVEGLQKTGQNSIALDTDVDLLVQLAPAGKGGQRHFHL